MAIWKEGWLPLDWLQHPIYVHYPIIWKNPRLVFFFVGGAWLWSIWTFRVFYWIFQVKWNHVCHFLQNNLVAWGEGSRCRSIWNKVVCVLLIFVAERWAHGSWYCCLYFSVWLKISMRKSLCMSFTNFHFCNYVIQIVPVLIFLSTWSSQIDSQILETLHNYDFVHSSCIFNNFALFVLFFLYIFWCFIMTSLECMTYELVVHKRERGATPVGLNQWLIVCKLWAGYGETTSVIACDM